MIEIIFIVHVICLSWFLIKLNILSKFLEKKYPEILNQQKDTLVFQLAPFVFWTRFVFKKGFTGEYEKLRLSAKNAFLIYISTIPIGLILYFIIVLFTVFL